MNITFPYRHKFCLKRIRILLAALIWSFSLGYAQGIYSKVRIPLSAGATAFRLATMGLALDESEGKRGVFVDIVVSERERKRLDDQRIPYSVLIDDWHRLYDEELSTDMRNSASFLKKSSVQGFHLGSMGGHLTYKEVLTEMDSLRKKYPTLVSNIDTLGKTILGNPIVGFKISKNPNVDEDEPKILYTSLHHAREPVGMMQLFYFMYYLVERYPTDERVKRLLDSRELYFVPVVNVDGYLYNQRIRPTGGGMWRKNRSFIGADTFGVDLNRNYGYKWAFDDLGSSNIKTNETYRGASGFSELELQAIRDLCIRKKFAAALNYHTHGNLLIYPWGFSDSDTQDSVMFRRLAEDLTSINRNTYGTGSQTVGYTTNGDSDDWMYGDTINKPKIISFTPELGNSDDYFWARPSRIVPIAEENLEANLRIAQFAGEYIKVKLVNAGEVDSAGTKPVAVGFENVGLKSIPSSVDAMFTPLSTNIVSVNPQQSTFLGSSNPLLTLDVNYAAGFNMGSHAQILARAVYTGGVTEDTLQYRIGKPTILFSDDAESTMAKWNATGTWNTAFTQAKNGTFCFTDSPVGNTPDNSSISMTTKQPIDLSRCVAAELRFWTKWHVETNYDFATVRVSTDSGRTWVLLSGVYTGPAGGMERQQPLFAPGYDGIKHDWVEEKMALDKFVPSRSLLLKFQIETDGYVSFDGWYLDDIQVIGYEGRSSVVTSRSGVLSTYVLEQNYPNPFNPTTEIRYTLPKSEIISLRLYDVLGREVRTLEEGIREAGIHSVRVDGTSFASGIYVYVMRAGEYVMTRKMAIVR